MTLPGDSSEYELLTEAARRTDAPGLICEIGTRLGGGIQAIIDGLQQPRAIVSVDPYGDLPYVHSEVGGIQWMGYNQQMMVTALGTISQACADKGHLWIPMILEDREFFQRFQDGVPVYDCQKKMFTTYALAHIDGPHDADSLLMAAEFFARRLVPGGCLVFDDIHYFQWDVMENALHPLMRESRGKVKAVYRRPLPR